LDQKVQYNQQGELMSNTTISTQLSGTGKDAIGVSPLRILSATAAALVLNNLVLYIGSAAGVSMKVSAPEPINVISVSVATVLPLLLAGAVVLFLAKRFPLRRLIAWVGLIFALVSSAGSFMAAADTPTALALAGMHFITGFAWFIALQPWVKAS
jgi:hypothetical protein